MPVPSERSGPRRTRDKILEGVRLWWPILMSVLFAIAFIVNFAGRVSLVEKKQAASEASEQVTAADVIQNTKDIAVMENHMSNIESGVNRINRVLDQQTEYQRGGGHR